MSQSFVRNYIAAARTRCARRRSRRARRSGRRRLRRQRLLPLPFRLDRRCQRSDVADADVQHHLGRLVPFRRDRRLGL